MKEIKLKGLTPEEAEGLRKIIGSFSAEQRVREEKDREAESALEEEGFSLEGGTTYPSEDFPRKFPVSKRLIGRVMEVLDSNGYHFFKSSFEEGTPLVDVYEDLERGITLYFNWAPLFRFHEESEMVDYGWGRIFIDAFDRAQVDGDSQARLEAGRIARIIRKVPGIKGRHFVGVVLCEGL